jgi:hypothetical protein
VGNITYRLSHLHAPTVKSFNHGDDYFLDQSTTTFISYNLAKLNFFRGSSTLAVSTLYVTISPGKSANIRLQIVAPVPASSDLWPTYGGYIAITNSHDSIITHVPYAGVAGVWKNRDIWARNSTSLYTQWATAFGNPTGLAALFSYATTPDSTATGLYADSTFTPLTKMEEVDVTNYGYVLAPAASTSRSANITITYLCKSDAALVALGLQRTNFVALTDLTAMASESFWQQILGVTQPYLAWTGVMPRTTYTDAEYVDAPHLYGVDGSVFTNEMFNQTVLLPAGVYQMNFVALKNFAYSNDEVDVITTPPFQLIYGTPLSSQFLASCQA